MMHCAEHFNCVCSFSTWRSCRDVSCDVLFSVLGLRHFAQHLGDLPDCSFINKIVALSLSSVNMNYCSNRSLLFYLLPFVASSSSLDFCLLLRSSFSSLFLLCCCFNVPLVAWRHVESTITTRWRVVTRAVVITHVIVENGCILRLCGTLNSMAAGSLPGAPLRCVSRVKCSKFGMFALGGCKIPLWAPG